MIVLLIATTHLRQPGQLAAEAGEDAGKSWDEKRQQENQHAQAKKPRTQG